MATETMVCALRTMYDTLNIIRDKERERECVRVCILLSIKFSFSFLPSRKHHIMRHWTGFVNAIGFHISNKFFSCYSAVLCFVRMFTLHSACLWVCMACCLRSLTISIQCVFGIRLFVSEICQKCVCFRCKFSNRLHWPERQGKWGRERERRIVR